MQTTRAERRTAHAVGSTVATEDVRPNPQDGDRIEPSDRSVDLPEERTLNGQGAERPSAGGRTLKIGFGAALPTGSKPWHDNSDLYRYGEEARRGPAPEGVGFAAASAFDTPIKITDDVVTLVTRILAAAENGDPNGDPAGVYVYNDGNGRRRQVTLGMGFTEDGGALRKVIQKYVDAGGLFAAEMAPFIPRIGGNPNLSGNEAFKALLKRAGRQDPAFARAQHEIFQENYLKPAAEFCMRERLEEPLSFLVIADSYLHSGGILGFLRDRFPATTPRNGGNEKTWVQQYVDARHAWLSTHSNRILRNTVYRTNAFKAQFAAQNWMLTPPIGMNGIQVSMPANG